ncbi:MAG TPA: hypothetical protein DCM38_05680 [Gammaproteobacteria bacterium]|nr:hypothetical protein [Gammaproteobacteria bacterium]
MFRTNAVRVKCHHGSVSYQLLSVISQLSISYQLSVISYQLSVIIIKLGLMGKRLNSLYSYIRS